MSADSRFALGVALLDARVPAEGRSILKAVSPRKRRPVGPPKPSAAQVEAERPFWGMHPDPEVAHIEDAFWRPGSDFLRRLVGAALGKAAPRSLVKASPGGPDLSKEVAGWGQLADLFKADRSPSDLMVGWQTVVDRLVSALFPSQTQAAVAQGLAVRSALLHRLGQQVSGGAVPTHWPTAIRDLTPAQREAMEWTRARGLQYMKRLDEGARDGLLQVLMETRQAGEGVGALQRRMFDTFSQLNRDWRRVALTETAMAVANGQLASVDPVEGWVAIWSAAKNACPYCLKQSGRAFRVVDQSAPRKDSETMVWASKSNVGRSAHRWSRKEGRYRDTAELWHPCIPAHPNCACRWILRRAVRRESA